ncbi:MAG: hypothetical protein U1C51_09925, partial [Candidatus Izemoplasmatales bacterium]|nr:hypothetical protein [Candidatus Izemoplasmatales bacterium]
GPSGIFAALVLARYGYEPLVIERGKDVDSRDKFIREFNQTKVFHKDGTILFGEGGAGTFSDGKLYTLVNDGRSKVIFDTFIKHGANQEIAYVNKPHIGTDALRGIIKGIRQEIISLGGEILFSTQLTKLIIQDGALTGIEVNHSEIIPTSICLLGIGHSARDTYELLYNQGVYFQPKPFSIGLRIEHPQALINVSQYGSYHSHPSLGAADYKLFHHALTGRTAYTFCMCPGGYVMSSQSEEGSVVTNGMSESRRDGCNANSALLVNVNPEDFGSLHPLAGIAFQRTFEQRAFVLGGSNYHAPIQKVSDYLQNRVSSSLGSVVPTYRPGVTLANLHSLFPAYINDTLKEALLVFNQKIQGFAMEDAILTAVETGSSAPVRIPRNESNQSNITGLYPMGEGAGYAGGITSSAIDGLKTAEEVIKFYQPINRWKL